MSKIIYIYNPVSYHYEIIESLLYQLDFITNSKCTDIIIYVHVVKNDSFETYIKSKHPRIIFGTPLRYDILIFATVYPFSENKKKEIIIPKDKTEKTVSEIVPNSSNVFYIFHEYDKNFKDLKNVRFLTSFSKKQRIYTHVLPFQDEIRNFDNEIPIFAIQGNLWSRTRNWKSLVPILEMDDRNFFIKLIGRGELPDILVPYRHKIILANNLDFISYHREFLNVFCLLPLVSPEWTKQYFKNKFTSSISYIKGYGLYSIMHKKLHRLYPEIKNVYSYTNQKGFENQFKKLLDIFYQR